MTMTARLHRAAAAALAALALASLPSPRGAAAADAAPLDGAETFRKELAAWATRYDEHLLAVMWGRTWKRIGQVSFFCYGDARSACDKLGTPRGPDLYAARIPVRGMDVSEIPAQRLKETDAAYKRWAAGLSARRAHFALETLAALCQVRFKLEQALLDRAGIDIAAIQRRDLDPDDLPAAKRLERFVADLHDHVTKLYAPDAGSRRSELLLWARLDLEQTLKDVAAYRDEHPSPVSLARPADTQEFRRELHDLVLQVVDNSRRAFQAPTDLEERLGRVRASHDYDACRGGRAKVGERRLVAACNAVIRELSEYREPSSLERVVHHREETRLDVRMARWGATLGVARRQDAVVNIARDLRSGDEAAHETINKMYGPEFADRRIRDCIALKPESIYDTSDFERVQQYVACLEQAYETSYVARREALSAARAVVEENAKRVVAEVEAYRE